MQLWLLPGWCLPRLYIMMIGAVYGVCHVQQLYIDIGDFQHIMAWFLGLVSALTAVWMLHMAHSEDTSMLTKPFSRVGP
jgi:hypothetical protein